MKYKITSAILTTYSGKKHKVVIDSDWMTEPIRKVKEKMLDGFCQMCKSDDPFVGIELRTKTLFGL